MNTKTVTGIVVLIALMAMTVPASLANAGNGACTTLSGTFDPTTGIYTETFTSVLCYPNDNPVTISGWIEIQSLIDNGALVFGLVDKGLIDSSDSGWFSGAYAYFGRRDPNLNIGPSDGFMGGEIVQVYTGVPYSSGIHIDFTMVIYDGEITVTYGGNDIVDTYGEIEDANVYDAYPGSEFESGAYFAINTWDDTNVVDYELEICGIEVQEITVDIDIKPGSCPNSINLNSRGVVPVAILGSDTFDVTTVDPPTASFADAAPLRWAIEDVNEDGYDDMIFHFKTQELSLTPSSASADLTGNLIDGTPISGSDSVNIVP